MGRIKNWDKIGKNRWDNRITGNSIYMDENERVFVFDTYTHNRKFMGIFPSYTATFFFIYKWMKKHPEGVIKNEV